MDKDKIIEFIEENFRNKRKKLIEKINTFHTNTYLSEIHQEFEQNIKIHWRAKSYSPHKPKITNVGDISNIYTFYLNEGLIVKDKNNVDWDFNEYLKSGEELHICQVWVNWFLPIYYLETTYEVINNRKKYIQYGKINLLDKNEIKIVTDIKAILNQKKYQLLDNQEFLNQIVKGVSTDCTEKNEATIFDCLFSDLIKPTLHCRKFLNKKNKIPQLSFVEYLDENRQVSRIEAEIYHNGLSPITITFDKNYKIIETESRGKLNGKKYKTIKTKYV
ncbi:MAG: hypothetical protein MUC49_07300 [Raineya sp.]|nr:hypothetical protein [Raineya sp.]